MRALDDTLSAGARAKVYLKEGRSIFGERSGLDG